MSVLSFYFTLKKNKIKYFHNFSLTKMILFLKKREKETIFRRKSKWKKIIYFKFSTFFLKIKQIWKFLKSNNFWFIQVKKKTNMTFFFYFWVTLTYVTSIPKKISKEKEIFGLMSLLSHARSLNQIPCDLKAFYFSIEIDGRNDLIFEMTENVKLDKWRRNIWKLRNDVKNVFKLRWI